MLGLHTEVLVPIAVGLAVTSLVRVHQRTWTAPSAFFWLYWCTFVTLTFLFAPSYTLTISGTVAIFVFCGLLSLGDFVGAATSRCMKPKHRICVHVYDFSKYTYKLATLCAVTAALGCLAVVVYVFAAGYALKDLLSLKDIFAIASEYTSARYQHPASYREPALAILFSTFVYVSALLGGVLFASSHKWQHKLVSVLWFVPAFAITVLLTTRAAFLLPTLLWLSSYFAVATVLSRGTYKLFSQRRIKWLVALAVFSVGIYMVGQIIRQGNYRAPNYEMVIDTTQSSFLGSTSSFTMWFSNNWDYTGPLGLGRRMLSGPLQWILPDFERASVATFPAIVLGQGNIPNENTTVAAIFREAIFDFSIYGTVPFFLFLGAIGGYSYCSANRGSIFGLCLLSVFYGIALYSMMGFIFKFTVVGIAYVFFTVSMVYVFRMRLRIT